MCLNAVCARMLDHAVVVVLRLAVRAAVAADGTAAHVDCVARDTREGFESLFPFCGAGESANSRLQTQHSLPVVSPYSHYGAADR